MNPAKDSCFENAPVPEVNAHKPEVNAPKPELNAPKPEENNELPMNGNNMKSNSKTVLLRNFIWIFPYLIVSVSKIIML